jgi:hypothetical protein
MVFSNVDRAREALTGWLIEAGLQASTNPARAVVRDAAREAQALEVSMVWPAVDTPMRG